MSDPPSPGIPLPWASDPSPTKPESPAPWSPPTLRDISLSATRSGLPDDTQERPFYETKPS